MKSSSKIIKKKDAEDKVKSYDGFFRSANFDPEEALAAERQSKADKIKLNAEMEAEKIISEAKANALMEEQSAFEEGLRKGLEKMKPLEEFLNNVARELDGFKDYYPHKLEPEMVNLVMSIANKIIKDKLDDDREIIVRNVQDAFKELTDKEFVKIRVHAEDLEMLSQFKPELLDLFHEIKKMEIVVDEVVDRGGCIIETNEGTIDATIRNQMKKLRGLISCESSLCQMKVMS